jgi:hypothetical protein
VQSHDGSFKRRTEELGLGSLWGVRNFRVSLFVSKPADARTSSGECHALYY